MTETKLWAVLVTFFCGGLGAIAQLMLKLGSNKITTLWSVINTQIILGFFFYFLGTVLFLIALKYGEVTVLYPLLAVSYIWVSILSMIFLGEKMSPLKWFGDFVIIAGIFVISLSLRKKSQIKKINKKSSTIGGKKSTKSKKGGKK